MVEDELSKAQVHLPVVPALAEEFYDIIRVTYSAAGLEGYLRDISNDPH